MDTKFKTNFEDTLAMRWDISMPKDISQVPNPKPQQAVKHDAGKIDWSILPIGASKEIIKVFSFGEQKYARGNYLNGGGLKYSRVINSLLRHIHSFMEGEDLDPETGLSHLAHAGCNIYMLLSYELNKDKFNNDDRETMVLK
jgi:hypothetical protein